MKTSHQQKLSESFKSIPKSYIREILNLANKPGMISFAGGLPNPKYFPNKQLAASSAEVLTHQAIDVLQYAGSQGYMPLRQWIATRYNAKYDLTISPNQIVITNGSQQTIDVTAKMLLNPGDQVLVEKPTYLGGLQALSAYRPEFIEVELEPDGINLLEVEKVCNTLNPKLMYAIPSFQNPSGICYSQEKKKDIAKLLKKNNLLLIEDDPYNELSFTNTINSPIYKYAPNHVLWSGSFSKMIAPGLRLGWVVLPSELISHFIKVKQACDLHSNNLSQHVIHHFLEHNNIEEHLSKIRDAYCHQLAYMQNLIQTIFPKEVKMTTPEGGMFLWLSFPSGINTDQLAANCLAEGVAIVPGNSFYAHSNNTSCIRINFSNSSKVQIFKGINIVAQELQKVMTKNIAFVD